MGGTVCKRWTRWCCYAAVCLLLACMRRDTLHPPASPDGRSAGLQFALAALVGRREQAVRTRWAGFLVVTESKLLSLSPLRPSPL